MKGYTISYGYKCANSRESFAEQGKRAENNLCHVITKVMEEKSVRREKRTDLRHHCFQAFTQSRLRYAKQLGGNGLVAFGTSHGLRD